MKRSTYLQNDNFVCQPIIFHDRPIKRPYFSLCIHSPCETERDRRGNVNVLILRWVRVGHLLLGVAVLTCVAPMQPCGLCLLHTALYMTLNVPLTRSAIARVNDGSHSFDVQPHLQSKSVMRLKLTRIQLFSRRISPCFGCHSFPSRWNGNRRLSWP